MGSLLAPLFAALVLTVPAASFAQSWQYVYDEVGRLKAAIAPNGDRADYEYDAVGNILAIRRSSAGALNISEFTPQIGKGGASVKITGSGFSTTLASNVVKFNGVAATVTAATATQLTATAPSTGTTGPISVTVGANTATTRESFIYSSTTITGAPTIATATPTCALAGTNVALTGTNFDVTPGATRVELGNMVALTTVTSPAALSFVVPPGGNSALRVVTALGISATSTQLFIPPVGACAEYETPVRPVLNGATATLNIATAGKNVAVLFAGNVGSVLSLQFSSLAPSVAGTTLNYTIYNTANAAIGSGSVSTAAMSIHVPVLPTTGTYAVVFSWNGPAITGTAAFQLQSDATLSTSGTALARTIPAGQSARVFFIGTASRDWTLDVSGLTFSGGGQSIRYQVFRSDGTSVLNGNCWPNGAGCTAAWWAITAGTHTVVFRPDPNTATATYTLKSWMSARATGTLTSGTTKAVATTVPGQVAQHTFSGTAGNQRGIALSGFSPSVPGSPLVVTVSKPDGSSLVSRTFAAGETAPIALGIDLPTLQSTGTYTVRIFPEFTYDARQTTTFSGQLLLTSDVAATLATNGTPTAVNLVAGQQARVTFSGVAGNDWTLDVSGVALAGGAQYLQYELFRSDGQRIINGTCYPTGTGCSAAWRGITAGTHSIVLTPYPSGASGSFTLKSWSSSRVAGSLAIGTPVTASTTVPGQAIEYNFSGTAGDRRELSLSAFSTSIGGASLTAEVKRPDGVSILTHTFAASNTTVAPRVLDLPALPVTGTYSVFIYPYPIGARPPRPAAPGHRRPWDTL